MRQAEEEAQRNTEKREMEERIRLEDEKRQEEKEKAVSENILRQNLSLKLHITPAIISFRLLACRWLINYRLSRQKMTRQM